MLRYYANTYSAAVVMSYTAFHPKVKSWLPGGLLLFTFNRR